MDPDEPAGRWIRHRRLSLDLTQEELARRVGCSAEMIGKIEAGSRRPSRQIALLLAAALGLAPEEQAAFVRWIRRVPELELGRAGAGDGATASTMDGPEREPATNPFKGLRAFEEVDAPFFFGRDALSRRLCRRLTEEHGLGRFLAVVGPSGSGKSSAVQAGLLPALRRGALPGGAPPVVVQITPGMHPFQQLEAGLLAATAAPRPGLLEQLREDERGLTRAVERVLPEAGALVLVVDQFEELFTLTTDEATRADFLDALFAAVSDPSGRLWVVATLRADFYDRPLLYASSGELLARRTEVVVPLTPRELYQAITGPAERAGLRLEEDLAATIIRDIGEQPGTLPLLQYALTELYERREGRRLTLGAYAASGGALGALARRAETLYAALDPAEQEEARQLFLRLVALGDGAEDTRRRVLVAELVSAARDEDAVQRVLDLYGRYRLLTFDRDPLVQAPTVEVAHEALLSSWGRLRDWLNESRERLLVQRRLLVSAAEWQQAGQEASFLARGARLAQFADLARETGPAPRLALTAEEQAYLDASREEQQRRAAADREQQERALWLQRRAANRLRYLLAGLALFLLVVAGLATWALDRTRVAQANEQVAQANLAHADALRLGAEANSLLLAHGDGQLVALLAIQALQREYSPEADAALSGAALLAYPLQVYPDFHGPNGTTFSPDGNYLAVAHSDKTIGIWDLRTGAVVHELVGHGDVVLRASFSPDGKYLASASFDGTARLWDPTTGQTLRLFAGHRDWVTEAVFSPDGQYLATSSKDGTARLWNVATAEVLRVFAGHAGMVWDVAFSPNGKYLLSGGEDKTVRLWDVSTGGLIRTLSGHTGGVDVVAYSPDGKYLASGGDDKTVRLWDAADGRQLQVSGGATGDVQGLAFSPDSTYLLSGGDTMARLWDVKEGRLVRLFAGHKNTIYGVAFAPDGTHIATSGVDSMAMLWPVLPPPGEIEFSGHDASVNGASFSPDGSRVVTGSDDHTARVWDATTGRELVRFTGHGLEVSSAVFSRDGTQVLTAGNDKTARIWDAATGKEVLELRGHTDPVSMAVFSPDGSLVASAGADSTAHLWDARTGANLLTTDEHDPARGWTSVAFSHTGKMIVMGNVDAAAYVRRVLSSENALILRGHKGTVTDVIFSPDDKSVLTSSWDGTARLWDVQSGREVRRFTGHSGSVGAVAISPDGRYVLTGGDDETARLWDAQTGQELRRYSGHKGPVRHVTFSPDGQYVLTASVDKTARIWQTDYHDTISYLCGLLNRDLTPEERTQYAIASNNTTCPPR